MCLYMQIILTNKMWDAHPMRMYPLVNKHSY